MPDRHATKTPVTDREHVAVLVLRSRGGDRAAFAKLVRRYENAAYATALAVVPRVEDAQDIVQDAFIIAYCKLGQLREPENFGSWLWSIVKRRALEVARRSQIVQFVSDSGETVIGAFAEASLDRLAAESRNGTLWEAVSRLPEKHREVVLLYYLDGFSYERTADYLGLPVTTVKGRLHQARVRLKEELSPHEREESSMDRAQVEKKVEEAICKIAREEIHETVPLGETQEIIIFCGVPAEIEICRTDGQDMLVTGAKASIGLSEEEARRSIDGIRLYHDQVPNFWDAGPHAGQIFAGTHIPKKDGKPVGRGVRVDAELWQREQGQHFAGSSAPPKLFPEIETRQREIQDYLRRVVGRPATRLTFIREAMEDIALPREAYTDAVRREFAANYTGNDFVHGPRGMLHLVIAVPGGRNVTLTGTGVRNLRVWGLKSNVTIVNQWEGAELEDVEGEVRLWRTAIKRAKGIRGKLIQSSYDIGGVDWSNDRTKRQFVESVIEDVTGEVRIDVAKVALDVSGITGTLDVRNRFGVTRLHVKKHEADSRYRVESDSGEVRIFLDEAVVDELSLTVYSICGAIDFAAIGGRILPKMNDLDAMVVSTVTGRYDWLAPQLLDADLVVKTRDGNITIEKTV